MHFLIAIFFITSLVIFIFSKYVARKNEFKKRRLIELPELYDSDIASYGINYETFKKIYNALGNSYSIDPRLIRSNDPLKKFFKIDSWDLDAGTEKMEEWLCKEFNLENSSQSKPY